MNKVCTKCKLDLPFSQFAPEKLGKLGLKSYCRSCARAMTRDYRQRNLEKSRRDARQWHKDNPEKSRLSGRNTKLKANYGITLDQYAQMLATQSNLCAVCRMPETSIDRRTNAPRALAVDHCHRTGRIRGLLYMNCNQLLGKAKDSTDICLRAATYLESFKNV